MVLLLYLLFYLDKSTSRPDNEKIHKTHIHPYMLHPQITSIRFCLDGDEPGRKAAAELMRKYYELGYEVEDCPPPAGYKDYNEWLVAAKLNLNQMNQRADEPVRA